MNNNVIIFGAKRFGVSNTPVSTEKYPNIPVVTIEPSKEGGKSRRVLFNAKASEVLNLEMGQVQQIVFGFVEGARTGLIANASLLGSDVVDNMTTYRTSKNKVNFDGNQKGKAISSSVISKELSSYFEIDSSVANEFRLSAFEAEGVESFSMEPLSHDDNVDTTEASNNVEEINVTAEEVTPNEPVLETVESNDSDFNLNRSEATTATADTTERGW